MCNWFQNKSPTHTFAVDWDTWHGNWAAPCYFNGASPTGSARWGYCLQRHLACEGLYARLLIQHIHRLWVILGIRCILNWRIESILMRQSISEQWKHLTYACHLLISKVEFLVITGAMVIKYLYNVQILSVISTCFCPLGRTTYFLCNNLFSSKCVCVTQWPNYKGLSWGVCVQVWNKIHIISDKIWIELSSHCGINQSLLAQCIGRTRYVVKHML